MVSTDAGGDGGRICEQASRSQTYCLFRLGLAHGQKSVERFSEKIMRKQRAKAL
jgi:hypothetical protein